MTIGLFGCECFADWYELLSDITVITGRGDMKINVLMKNLDRHELGYSSTERRPAQVGGTSVCPISPTISP